MGLDVILGVVDVAILAVNESLSQRSTVGQGGGSFRPCDLHHQAFYHRVTMSIECNTSRKRSIILKRPFR